MIRVADTSATADGLTVHVMPIATGAAVVVVPVMPLSDELREALADVVRDTIEQTVQDEFKKAGIHRPSFADKLTIIGFPLFIGTAVYGLYVAFQADAQAAVWAVALVVITAILMWYARGGEG